MFSQQLPGSQSVEDRLDASVARSVRGAGSRLQGRPGLVVCTGGSGEFLDARLGSIMRYHEYQGMGER